MESIWGSCGSGGANAPVRAPKTIRVGALREFGATLYVTATVGSCALELTLTLAVYVPTGNMRAAEVTEIVTWLGLPGLAVPAVGDTLIQFAGAAEVYWVVTP